MPQWGYGGVFRKNSRKEEVPKQMEGFQESEGDARKKVLHVLNDFGWRRNRPDMIIAHRIREKGGSRENSFFISKITKE